MLCKRVIAALTFNNGVLSRTKKFNPDYIYTDTQIGLWGIDEIIVLDVTRDKSDRTAFFDTAIKIADDCFAPTTIGGGIRSVDDAIELFRDYGADKASINTGAVDRPELITEMANKYGSQSVVLSMDVRNNEVYSDCGRNATGMDPVEWAKTGVELGAGEIMVTAMDKDGSLMGYDLDMCEKVARAVPVPTIILGGAGSWKHFHEGIKAGAAGVCTQNIYHFTESSIAAAKTYLSERGVHVRA